MDFSAALIAALAVASQSPVLSATSPQDLSRACAVEARYPTHDDPTGKEWEDLDPETAIRHCRAASAANPADADARANLARALVRAERTAEGLAELRRSAAEGSGQAMRQLAIQLVEAGSARDREEAKGLLEQAAKAGYLPAFATLAEYLAEGELGEKDPEAAFAWAERGHRLGDPVSTSQLGLFYEKGTGVARDLSQAARHYEIAALAGDSAAMRNLALALSNGEGVERDHGKALDWYRRAAEAGNLAAFADIGDAFHHGRGMPRDDAEALRWFRKGHEAGEPSSTARLAYMTEKGFGGEPADLARALELYREAAEKGDSWAMLQMGEQYYWGFGTTRDYAAANLWYRRAAEAGQSDAFFQLGYAYQKGEGAPVDPREAIRWYEKGREAGCAECTKQLGTMYGLGVGVERDQKRANALYLEAAEAGDTDAMRRVAIGYRQGGYGAVDLEKARYWDQRAAEEGGALTKLELGRSLAFGVNGYEIDRAEGRRWLERSLSYGNEEAGGLLVLATLADETLADRSGQAAAILLKQAERGAGWAMATLAYPREEIARLPGLPEAKAWQARLDGPVSPDTLFSAAEALRHGRTARQDFGRALALARRAESGDLLNARAQELEMLISLNLYSAALERYAQFTASDAYASLPADQKATFERRFVRKLEQCFRFAIGSIDTMVQLADRGMAAAAIALGRYYGSQDNPEHDPAKARRWYARAVELGSQAALVNLGYLHSFGLGGPKDEKAAYLHYLRAAEGGDITAQHNVAVMLNEGRGVEKNDAESVRWLTLAAAGGYTNSQLRLATNRFRGEGTPVDPSGAMALLREAVKSPTASGLYYMGLAHLEGAGVPRDREAGLRWLRYAASLPGDDSAAAALARAYAGAWSVKPDAEKAYAWLEEARGDGSEWAARVLSSCRDARTVQCIRADKDSGPPDRLMKRPAATLPPLPGLSDEEGRLRQERDAALAEGNYDAARDAFDALDMLYRLYDRHEALLANNAVRILQTELQMERVHGSRDNYFALLNSSCSWANASDAARAAGRPEAAVLLAKVAVNRLQQARGYIADLDDEIRECFIAMHRDRYRELAGRFLDLGRLSEAEIVLGMLKDFELQGYTGETVDRGVSFAPMPLTEAQAQVLEQYERAAARFTGDLTEPGFVRALNDLSAGLHALETAPQRLAGPAQAAAPDLAEIVRRSGRTDVAAVQAIVQPDRIYWIVTGAGGQQVVRVPIKIGKLTRQIRDFHDMLSQADEGIEAQAGAIYREVFEPVDARLREMGATELLLSLDENLRYVPFAALHDGKGWLVERYAFANFRKAEDLANSPALTAQPRVAGFGVSEAAPGFSALPMVANEVRAIVIEGAGDEGILAGTSALDAAFDRDAFERSLGGHYGAIHVASHFALSPHGRDSSYLLIGNHEKLPLSAFRGEGGLKFEGAPFLALSACETAVEVRDANGAELDSLAGIVRKAGASHVLASLWQVADASTPDLMTGFYRERFVAGSSNARSLREAQLALIARGRAGQTPLGEGAPEEAITLDNPFFWAPFVVTADLAGTAALP